jgi:hypothetical protein
MCTLPITLQQLSSVHLAEEAWNSDIALLQMRSDESTDSERRCMSKSLGCRDTIASDETLHCQLDCFMGGGRGHIGEKN